MRSPLTVRISDGVRDQHVTRFVEGLRFTKTAPGGHHSASVQMEIPDDLLGGLGPADRLYIYDGRNTRAIWDGYVENPGRTAVLGGGRYDMSAMGGVVLASDNGQAVVFRSTDLSGSHWKRHDGSHPDGTAEVDQAVVPGADAIKVLIPTGTELPVAGPRYVGFSNHALNIASQRLHTASVLARGGREDVVGDTEATVMRLSHVAEDNVYLTTSDVTLTIAPAGAVSAGGRVTLSVEPADFTSGTAPTTVIDNTWAAFRDFVLTPVLLTASGADASPTSATTVLAGEVAAHVVGSLLPQVDGTTATIELGTFAIQNLAYLEAVKPFQILDDLTLYEPNFLWEILESNAAGKHRFAYRAWPPTPRYEISGREFTESGGEVDLCNRIVVSWKDAAGAEQTTVRTASVPDLGTRIKDAEPVTLPDGQGSLANAQRIGDEVLAALNTPTRSGTAVVRQPIQDRLTGMMMMPWEIEPGYLVRVRDIGVDLRLTEMTYDDANCSASLSLGTPVLTQAQRIARLRR